MPFLIGIVLGLFLVPASMAIALATGLVDRGTDVRLAIHTRPVPVLGGVAVVAASFTAVAIAGQSLPGAVVAAVLVAMVAGLADDMRQLPPLVRLGVLFAAGVVLAAGGFRIDALGALGGAAMVALTAACTNATNLLDGQNGLAGGVAAIGAVGLALAAPAHSGVRALGLALAGALLSFLVFNLPGRVFLGNGGAYAVGTMLAAMAGGLATTSDWRTLAVAAASLGVLAFELIATVCRRIASGASMTSGDRNHSYDILAERTGSRLRSTAVMCLAGVLLAVAAVVPKTATVPGSVAVALACVAVVTGFASRATNRHPHLERSDT